MSDEDLLRIAYQLAQRAGKKLVPLSHVDSYLDPFGRRGESDSELRAETASLLVRKILEDEDIQTLITLNREAWRLQAVSEWVTNENVHHLVSPDFKQYPFERLNQIETEVKALREKIRKKVLLLRHVLKIVRDFLPATEFFELPEPKKALPKIF